MVDLFRRKLLKTGAAATAIAAAAKGAFAQQRGQGGAGSFYVKGPVRIHYQEVGRGVPLLLIAGGGLNSTIAGLSNPFDAIGEFKGEYRCIASDLRTANAGQSYGPLEVDRPWDSFTDDHLGVMDHLGLDKFMVMGFCIGGPLIWNLLKRAPNRVVAAVLAQPSGWRPEMPTLSYDTNMAGWGPDFVKRHPEVTMATVDKFLTKMYRNNPQLPSGQPDHEGGLRPQYTKPTNIEQHASRVSDMDIGGDVGCRGSRRRYRMADRRSANDAAPGQYLRHPRCTSLCVLVNAR